MILSKNQIEQLKEVMTIASKAVMNVYSDDNFGVEKKSDDSPLTLADIASNNILVEGLKRITPTISILSEEQESVSYKERKERDLFWCVDPLDGTKEFIKRNGEFCICLGLVSGGKPIFGMIGVPAQNKIYWGDHQHGAWVSEGVNITKLPGPIQEREQQLLRIVGSRSHFSKNDDLFAEYIKKQGYEVAFKSCGSALKLCALAEGSADIYPRFKPTMERDIAAGHAILLAVGYDLIDYMSGRTMQYNKENLRNGSFIAGPLKAKFDRRSFDCNFPNDY